MGWHVGAYASARLYVYTHACVRNGMNKYTVVCLSVHACVWLRVSDTQASAAGELLSHTKCDLQLSSLCQHIARQYDTVKHKRTQTRKHLLHPRIHAHTHAYSRERERNSCHPCSVHDWCDPHKWQRQAIKGIWLPSVFVASVSGSCQQLAVRLMPQTHNQDNH